MRSLLQRIRGLLMPEGELSDRVVASGIWSTLINVSDRGLRLIKLVVLVNLLAPEDFGLMGFAMLAIAVFTQLSNLRPGTTLIQKEAANVDSYLDTAWIISIARGVLLVGVAYVFAPYVASFFDEPRVVDILVAVSIAELIHAFSNPGIIYFSKNLQFEKKFIHTSSMSVANVGVAITAGILLGNVWALVFGRIAGKSVGVVVSYLVHDYRPGFEYDHEKAREFVDFGKWLLASEVLTLLIYQGDDIFVGWFLGAAALGLYQVSYRLSNAPATEITGVISSVALPAYSELQSDAARLRNGYYHTLRLVTAVTFPMTVGIVVVAPVFVPAFLGPQWVEAIPTLQVLAVWGGIRAIEKTVYPIVTAIGRPDIAAKTEAFRLLLIGATIFPLTQRYGLVGAATSLVIAMAVENPVAMFWTVRQIEGSLRKVATIVLFPLLGSLLMGLGVHGIRIGAGLAGPIGLSMLVLSGVLLYSVTMLVLGKYGGYDIGETVTRILA